MSHVRPLLSQCLESDTCGQCPSGHMSQSVRNIKHSGDTSDMCHSVSCAILMADQQEMNIFVPHFQQYILIL